MIRVSEGDTKVGIDDRDYMRDQASPSNSGLSAMIRLCALVAGAAVVLICFRLPVPWGVKIGILIAAAFAIRWLVTIPRKLEGDFYLQEGRQLERDGKLEAAVRSYERAHEIQPTDSATTLRLLAVYNASLQVNRAKGLIEKLNGRTFHEDEAEELRAIISQYRKIKLSKSGSRLRVVLID